MCENSEEALHQRDPYCFGIKLFNCLPLKIKELAHDIKLFRTALKIFIHSKSFYIYCCVLRCIALTTDCWVQQVYRTTC
jgi:hypothetical protein